MITKKFNINDKVYEISFPDDIPLLWLLRDYIALTGTKYGCGQGTCGSCVVHINGIAVRSCITPAVSVLNEKIVTIEGISKDLSGPVHSAWLSEQVSQ